MNALRLFDGLVLAPDDLAVDTLGEVGEGDLLGRDEDGEAEGPGFLHDGGRNVGEEASSRAEEDGRDPRTVHLPEDPALFSGLGGPAVPRREEELSAMRPREHLGPDVDPAHFAVETRGAGWADPREPLETEDVPNPEHAPSPGSLICQGRTKTSWKSGR